MIDKFELSTSQVAFDLAGHDEQVCELVLDNFADDVFKHFQRNGFSDEVSQRQVVVALDAVRNKYFSMGNA